MTGTLKSLIAALGGFFAWWGAELAGLLPRALTSGSKPAPPNRLLSVEDGGVRFVLANGATTDELFSPDEAIDMMIRDKGRNTIQVGLRLANRACFSRRVELPSSAVRDFPRLLAMDLERATPFKPRDVSTAYFVEAEQRTPGKTAIRQLVAKRASTDGLIGALQTAGLKVTRVDCWAADGQSAMPVNFLEVATPAGAQRRGWFWPAALTASAVGIAAYGAYSVLERHDAALKDVRAQTAKLRAKLQAQTELETKSKERQAEAANFAQVLASTPSKATALEELTRLLPDTARVTDLKLEGSTVDISGIAQSAIGLVPVLERSTFFVDATSTAPVMFDQREGKERFSIRVRIRGVAP
jgi:general secretion pathway protein L